MEKKNKNRGAEVEGKIEIESTFVQRDQVADGGNLSQECLTCHVHDLVRELCLSMAKEYQFLYVHKSNYNTSLDRGRARRLAAHQTVGFLFSSQASIQHLRSYLHFDLCEGEMSQEMGGIFRTKQGYKWLRVFDLKGTYKPLLPKALGKLVHLRYLGLRRTWLDSLPSSFGDLFNLQTLDLKWTSIKSLPSSISRMENLRHLYFNWGECSTDLLHQPNHISFNNLQTLWGVLVPQGTFVVNLNQCINLRKLGMEGDLMSHGKELTGWLSRFDCLESLKLCSTAGDLLPSELPSSSAVVEQSHALPALILLKSLRTLLAENQILDIHEGSMQNLKELEINKCEYLRELPSGLQFLNHLKELRLPAMSDHLKERVLPNTGADWYKIAHIPFLRPHLLFLLRNGFGNRLNGSIPSTFQSLGSLTYLDLSSNEFSGTIPASIGDLEHLLTLNLTRNQLNGPLSANFGNLRSIQIVEADTDEVFAQNDFAS
ncbi:hypothetical protein GIB67_017755 [Kingdonia uniflora]|uniref:Disease resistance R13L4/SHOC-2-like LRR domain-containing protein n=1 Tax=Kingdonia uniflora TaxID=39325 RepID=A0A7J7LPY9_9MAGN|nr:hypothetical protein GIB67_017755 [Kingdonia uniflora]